MAVMLPPEKWDKCKFCGSTRKAQNESLSGQIPSCFRQGCPGQHVATGLPLDK